MGQNRSSILRFGGASAVAVGVLYLLVGATHLLLPRAQLRGAGGVSGAFFESLARDSLVFSIHYWIVVLLSLLFIAVIVAVLELLHDHRTGVVSWAAIVGILGAALSTLDFAYVGVTVPRVAAQFVRAPRESQSILLLTGMPHIDPCFLATGLMGVFAIVANTAVLRHKLVPRFLGVLGVVGGVIYLLVFIGSLSRTESIGKRFWRILLAGVASLTLVGCLPPAANLQDARMVGKDNVRLTGFSYGLDETGEGGEKIANVYGGLFGVGTSDRTEIQFRLDHFDFAGDDNSYEFVSIGPKIELVKDRLALLVPLGVYSHGGILWESVQIHPGLLGSLPVGRYVEINAAERFILPFDQDYLTWINLGFGVGLSTDFDRWALLPEVSYSVCLDEDEVDPIFSYGVALVFLPGD